MLSLEFATFVIIFVAVFCIIGTAAVLVGMNVAKKRDRALKEIDADDRSGG